MSMSGFKWKSCSKYVPKKRKEFFEYCKDNAFGRCQFPYGLNVDTYKHLLGSETTKLLERELTRLFAGGYRWRHKYTQCVIQNILYTSRHRISYDPGLCSRVMQFTLPDVPPEIFSDLQSTDPEELAYIKFKPNRDDPDSAMFADEIFTPPVRDIEDYEVKETRKRSSVSNDDGNARNNWVENLFETDDDEENKQYPEITNKETLFKKLLEAADETGKLFEQFQNKADRYPEDDVPVVRTELSSDLNQRPVFSEGGMEWIPTDDDELFLRENDIIDSYEKKRIARPNEVYETNDIPVSGREYDDDDDNNDNDNEIPTNGVQLISGEPTYESQPQDENEDKNFRWNYKHINKGIDDLTKFSRRYKNTKNSDFEENDDKNLKDVIEDDYLEDQLYAILPVDNGMSTFTRNMRYDTKKPGPTYMIHEDEDGETSEMAADQGRALISRLSKATREDQLLALLKTPVRTSKTSTLVVPSRETIDHSTRRYHAHRPDEIFQNS